MSLKYKLYEAINTAKLDQHEEGQIFDLILAPFDPRGKMSLTISHVVLYFVHEKVVKGIEWSEGLKTTMFYIFIIKYDDHAKEMLGLCRRRDNYSPFFIYRQKKP